MEKRRKEAGVAAAVVDDAFASFEIFLQEKRRQLLKEIEVTHWRLLKEAESRIQHLHRIEETQAALQQLADSLTRGEMNDLNAVRVAGVLKKHFREIDSRLAECAPQQRAKLKPRSHEQLPRTTFRPICISVGSANAIYRRFKSFSHENV